MFNLIFWMVWLWNASCVAGLSCDTCVYIKHKNRRFNSTLFNTNVIANDLSCQQDVTYPNYGLVKSCLNKDDLCSFISFASSSEKELTIRTCLPNIGILPINHCALFDDQEEQKKAQNKLSLFFNNFDEIALKFCNCNSIHCAPFADGIHRILPEYSFLFKQATGIIYKKINELLESSSNTSTERNKSTKQTTSQVVKSLKKSLILDSTLKSTTPSTSKPPSSTTPFVFKADTFEVSQTKPTTTKPTTTKPTTTKPTTTKPAYTFSTVALKSTSTSSNITNSIDMVKSTRISPTGTLDYMTSETGTTSINKQTNPANTTRTQNAASSELACQHESESAAGISMFILILVPISTALFLLLVTFAVLLRQFLLYSKYIRDQAKRSKL